MPRAVVLKLEDCDPPRSLCSFKGWGKGLRKWCNPEDHITNWGERGCFHLLSMCVLEETPGGLESLQVNFRVWNINKWILFEYYNNTIIIPEIIWNVLVQTFQVFQIFWNLLQHTQSENKWKHPLHLHLAMWFWGSHHCSPPSPAKTYL